MPKHGWNSKIMASFFKKEATYNAGVVMDSTSACTLTGFTNGPAEWDDKVVNDREEISGREFGYDQKIVEQRVKIPLAFPKAKPNDLIGLCALALGSITSTQDGTAVAYKHRIVPMAASGELPSIQVEERWGDTQQYAYTGVKANTLKISAEEGGFVNLEAELLGSGSRSASATAFPPSVSESWLLVNKMNVYLESGNNISIDSVLTQGAENISSATPRDISALLKSFEISWNNNLNERPGFAGQGVLHALDHKRRSCELKFTMLFENTTDLDNYINQQPYAVEFDLKGSIIDGAGTLYYGVQIIIPRFKLKKAPMPQGGADEFLTVDFECEVFEDGTNPVLIVEGYNAISGYLQ